MVVIKVFVVLKFKMKWFWVDDISEDEKVNKNVVARTKHSEYKDVLLDNLVE